MRKRNIQNFVMPTKHVVSDNRQWRRPKKSIGFPRHCTANHRIHSNNKQVESTEQYEYEPCRTMNAATTDLVAANAIR
jgi:hypothetical protein